MQIYWNFNTNTWCMEISLNKDVNFRPPLPIRRILEAVDAEYIL